MGIERRKYCIMYCGPSCDCMPTAQQPLAKTETVQETFEKQVHVTSENAILNCTLCKENVEWLLDLAQNGEDEILRAMSRARLEANALSIIGMLL
jgi:hypothetical protein